MRKAKVELDMKELESTISALKFKLAHLRTMGANGEIAFTQNLINMLQADLIRLKTLVAEEELEEQLEEMEESQDNPSFPVTIKDLRKESGISR